MFQRCNADLQFKVSGFSVWLGIRAADLEEQDRATTLRILRDYHEKVEYVPLNPVKRGLVKRPEDWKWTSMAEYAGVSGEEQESVSPSVDGSGDRRTA